MAGFERGTSSSKLNGVFKTQHKTAQRQTIKIKCTVKFGLYQCNKIWLFYKGDQNFLQMSPKYCATF